MPSIISILPAGYGHNRVTIVFRGKEYSAVTSNTIATDAYKNDNGRAPHRRGYWLTKKHAERQLIDEVKQKNNL